MIWTFQLYITRNFKSIRNRFYQFWRQMCVHIESISWLVSPWSLNFRVLFINRWSSVVKCWCLKDYTRCSNWKNQAVILWYMWYKLNILFCFLIKHNFKQQQNSHEYFVLCKCSNLDMKTRNQLLTFERTPQKIF